MNGPERCGVRILGTGSAIPSGILDNATLAARFDVDEEWIHQRTGIRERRICQDGESTFTLQVQALERALESAGVDAADLSMVVAASVSSEMTCPSNASRVSEAVGAPGAGAFDLVAACSGFVYAMNTAECLVRSGRYETIAVVGCDSMSLISDANHRGSAILFGDAAGAAILQRCDDPEIGCFYQVMGGDSTQWPTLYIPRREEDEVEGDGFDLALGMLRMKGKEVYKFAVKKFQEVAEDLLRETGLGVDDISQFICHQSNARIIESAQTKLGLPPEKVYMNIDRYGNSSSGSVGLCLDELWRSGRISRGDVIVMLAFGGGLTWASGAWRI